MENDATTRGRHCFILLLAAFSLSACAQTVDERFEQACEEQREAGGKIADMTRGACQYGDNVPDYAKEDFIRAWEHVKETQAALED